MTAAQSRTRLVSSSAAKAAAVAKGLVPATVGIFDIPPPEPQSNTAPDSCSVITDVDLSRTNHQARRNTIALFRERWPEAFARPWPLRIGVGKEIVEALEGIVPPEEIGSALRHWCGGDIYLGRIASGKCRIGLDGAVGEPATEEQRQHATKRLMRRLQRRAAR